ncbi:unnamed protein product [marine sediment metagenome]|uniref:Uncharacterized protein n=1 Tax=marine sediment metagenome TaxID=412755 RepID=X0Z8B4_9ZZZZ
MKSLADDFSKGRLRRELLLFKSWIQFFKANYNGAEELAQESLKLTKEQKLGSKLDLAINYFLLGFIGLAQGNQTKALDYAMKSLKRNKELNLAVAIAEDYSFIARIYRLEGDYDQALHYCKKSLSIAEITKQKKLEVLRILSEVYYHKSEFNKAIKYLQQALALSEELNVPFQIINNLCLLGYFYRFSKFSLALEYFERSLMLSEKWGYILGEAHSLSLLITAYIDENSRGIANRYLSRLSELFDKTKDKGEVDISFLYLFSKAYMMKTSTMMHDHVEAQALFKKLIDYISANPAGIEDYLFYSLGNLCDLLLEELSIYNDPKILGELLPLITKSIDIAETGRNYFWLVKIKSLQAKLALIQMNIKEAKKLMVEAQHIAELHGLHSLAWGISSDHDKLLEQVDVWEIVKREKSSIGERIKLASINKTIDRIQGKSALEPPELVDEQSTVLLILSEGGVLVFSYPFSDEWRVDEDLFSSFLSAFASFGTEFFSKGLDRVKFGDDILLMESIGSISFCYLYKGQTYLAKQKLVKFIEELQGNSLLWQDIENLGGN